MEEEGDEWWSARRQCGRCAAKAVGAWGGAAEVSRLFLARNLCCRHRARLPVQSLLRRNAVTGMLLLSRRDETAFVKVFRVSGSDDGGGGGGRRTAPPGLCPHSPAETPLPTTTTMTITLHSPLQTLIKSYFPRLSQHVESLGAPVRAIFASWFRGA